MTRYFKGNINIGYHEGRVFEFEVEDDATEKEIEQTAYEEMCNWLEWDYAEVEDDDYIKE